MDLYLVFNPLFRCIDTVDVPVQLVDHSELPLSGQVMGRPQDPFLEGGLLRVHEIVLKSRLKPFDSLHRSG